MKGIDLREVEFSSDGTSDSLTLTMSPALFHENLKREISTAKREDRDLAILVTSLKPERFDSVAKFQKSLIELAFALRSGLRGGDFFARVSDRGFWVLLRTSEKNADVIIQRLNLGRLEELEMYIVARKFDDHAEWIERVDQLQFKEN